MKALDRSRIYDCYVNLFAFMSDNLILCGPPDYEHLWRYIEINYMFVAITQKPVLSGMENLGCV